MGMYTGLRCKVKVKPEWREAINQLIDPKNDDDWRGIQIADPFIMKVVDIWSQVGRSGFIPFGGIAYVDWDENDEEWKRSFKDDIWVFQCTLKNYEDEIGTFLKSILPNIICESYIIETRYEEDEKETKYKLIDGSIVRIYDQLDNDDDSGIEDSMFGLTPF